jgi:hypothetical protein
MLTHLVALVDCTKSISATDMSQAAAALQKQATRDLGPIWGIDATVNYFPDLASVPVGYWPIIIVSTLNDPTAGGYHTDKSHQPFSLILRGTGSDWTLDCSHELCEMLVDPYGNRMTPGLSLKAGQGRVSYLVECCDPCEDAHYAYTIDGVMVSDFYTPEFFSPATGSGVRYSFNGSITKSLEVLPNGYITWQLPADNSFWQLYFFNGKRSIVDISTQVSQGSKKSYDNSLRSCVDRIRKPTAKAKAASLTAFRNIKDNKAKLGIHEAMRKAQKVNWSNTLKGLKIPCVD